MKAQEIFKGQTYTTTMENRFSSKIEPLAPIKILAHVEGFVIFKRDGIKQAIETSSFISTFIKACKYALKKRIEYELATDLPLRLIKKK